MNTFKRVSVLFVALTGLILMLPVSAHTTSEHFIYLPLFLKAPFVIADFNSCDGQNNLGGAMGAAYEPTTNDRLIESYIPEAIGGCHVKLDYHIPDQWGAFWLKLQEADLTLFKTLSFHVRFAGNIDETTDMAIKVELKRGCQNFKCAEVWVHSVPAIADEWQLKTINLVDFHLIENQSAPPSLTKVEELVFTFEKGQISSEGTVFLDNIVLEP